MPGTFSQIYIQILESLGIPEEARTFIYEHVTIDVAHNILMDKCVDRIIQTQSDLDRIIYIMQATGKLYVDMLLAAFEAVEK